MILIAEISNMHEGSVEKAKELIRVARESGADLVKGQAFLPSDMVGVGTMHYDFYRKCALKEKQLYELMEYARSIGTTFFCSVLSASLADFEEDQDYYKLTARQTASFKLEQLKSYDLSTCFVSMAKLREYPFKRAQVLYAEGYNMPFDVGVYKAIGEYINRPIGVSHHNRCIKALLEICKRFSVPVIEKHFYLGDEISFKGQVYRDCEHAADPNLFAELATAVKGK